MSTSSGKDNNDYQDDNGTRPPNHPLHIDDDDDDDNDTMEESTAMLQSFIQHQHDNNKNSNNNNNSRNDNDDGNDENNKASSPRSQARSLDQFMEDAYQEHAIISCWKQWQYTILMLSLGVANSSDASEILCISYILSDRVFIQDMLLQDDNEDSSWRGGLLAAAVFAGMLVGGLLVGTLGDWQGRRPMLLIGLILNMTAGLLSACAPNVISLAALRFFAGCGIGATVPPLFTLVAELAPPSRRGFYVTLCASFWMVGSIFVAVAAMLILSQDIKQQDPNDVNHILHPTNFFMISLQSVSAWRILAVVCAIPSAIGALLVYILVPESPRFLALQGNYGQALVSANSLSSALQYSGPPLHRWEMEEQYRTTSNAVTQQHPNTTNLNGEDENADGPLASILSTVRFIQLALIDFCISARKLYTPQLVTITCPLQMVWFSLSFGSYGLMTWINLLFFEVHLENVYFNALLFALSNLPGNLLTAYLMDRSGRSSLLVGSILSASASLLAFALFASSSTETAKAAPNTYGIVISACCFQCFTIAAWNTIDVMTSELFPTTVRSTGMGVCAASGRIGAMVAQFVNGALVGRPVRLLVVASITLAMGALTPFLLPSRGDMTGRPVHDDIEPNNPTSTTAGPININNHVTASSQQPNSSVGHPQGLSRRIGNGQSSYQQQPVSKDNRMIV